MVVVLSLYDVIPSILCVHLLSSTLSLLSCLELAFIILFAQYEITLITRLLYNISDVFMLVNLVILFSMVILWLTFDIMLFTFGVWSRPLIMYTPRILSLSDCWMTYSPAYIIMSFVMCLYVGLHVMMNFVLSGFIFRKLML